jgi:exopolyphosphatase/pppGpp-phosphohydrolase
MRVGVIEIGSRAVRLLVADVSRERGMVAVTTRVSNAQLMDSILKGEPASQRQLSEVMDTVKTFRDIATRQGVGKICVFGTEAIRQLALLKNSAVNSMLSTVDVINASTEADCSLHAALMGLGGSEFRNVPLLVIDQGAGSTELVTGIRNSHIQVQNFASLPLGGNSALDLFRRQHMDIEKFAAATAPAIEQIQLATPGVKRAIVQGSVATKCAWFRLNLLAGTTDRRYDPTAVQGEFFTLENLEKLVAYAEQPSASRWKAWFNRENPDEFNRIKTGVAILGQLLSKFEITDFFVSAFGTRHGMAWRLAMIDN